MMKEKIDITGVSETMLVPLYARALESKKENPAFYDAFAVKITDSLDYDFEKHNNKMNMWGCAARTIILDREASDYISNHPSCSVVNLGCGLDARFDRLDNGQIEWYNIDFEEVMSVRRRLIPENERVHEIGCSITDKAWVSRITGCDDVLIIAEGVLMYLTEDEVKNLFSFAADSFAHVTVLCETMAQWMVEHQKMHNTIRNTTAVFKWGVNETNDFTRICPQYKMTGDFNFTDVMKRFSPVFVTLISPMLRSRNNSIGRFEKTAY